MSFELPSVTELEKMINALSDKEFNQIRTEYSAEVFYQEMKELQKRINKNKKRLTIENSISTVSLFLYSNLPNALPNLSFPTI